MSRFISYHHEHNVCIIREHIRSYNTRALWRNSQKFDNEWVFKIEKILGRAYDSGDRIGTQAACHGWETMGLKNGKSSLNKFLLTIFWQLVVCD